MSRPLDGSTQRFLDEQRLGTLGTIRPDEAHARHR